MERDTFHVPRGRSYPSRGRGNSLRPINSVKNIRQTVGGLSGTAVFVELARAVDSPVLAQSTQVQRGCIIKAVYLSFDVCGLGGTGVLNTADLYLAKNPGDNLTLPDPDATGISDNKKFIFKTWRIMIMRNQDGNVPVHFEGWLKIPKRYQRFGSDDTLIFAVQCTATITGHFSAQAIYKWYT